MSLILVELNEINFDLVKKYIKGGSKLPNFKKLIDGCLIETSSESAYEQLEPWVQWVSVHTGKPYEQHGVFRLGDIVGSGLTQIFEEIENLGFKVGVVSAMNAENKLKDPAYFIPDPWTKTSSDKSFFSKCASSFVAQVVNDNSKGRISLKSFAIMSMIFMRAVRLKTLPTLGFLAFKSISKPWFKSLFFDFLVFEIHSFLVKKNNPDFSTVFLNAGAHIQHHYLRNSRVYLQTFDEGGEKKLEQKQWSDPVEDMLVEYDGLLGELLTFKNVEIIVATGLSQKPFEDEKFYYRLMDHKSFLADLEIHYSSLDTLMTRDFVIWFDSNTDAQLAKKVLESILVNDQEKMFSRIEDRGVSLFVTLTYSKKILDTDVFSVFGRNEALKSKVVFVAQKNGEHQGKGFAYFSDGLIEFAPKKNAHVSELYNVIKHYFVQPTA